MAIDYESLLGQAQGMYGSIMGGYASQLGQQQANQQNVMSGYNQLQSSVLGGLAGQGKARSQEIADQYTAASGRAMQGLVSSGLGNSTVTSSVNRGLAFDQSKSQNQLAEQVAGMNAQYQSQLGLAGLQYQNTANLQNSALLGQMQNYQAGWQSNLLGAALSGQARKEQMDFQRNQGYQNNLAGGGLTHGGGGSGGQVLPTRWDYPGSRGGWRPYQLPPDNPMVPNPFASMGEPIVLPGPEAGRSALGASMIGDLLGGGLAGGGFSGFGGLAGFAGSSGYASPNEYEYTEEDWFNYD